MKKKLITIGIPLIIIAPLMSIVSCGNSSEEYKSEIIENTSPIVSNNVVKLLDKKLEENVYDENTYLLNAIKLYDENSSDEGDFNFNTNDISVNTHIMNHFAFKSDENKAEYLYELIFHEYNHFKNSIYLNALNPNDSQYDQTIYSTITGSRTPEIWNKSFLDKFKHELKYDQDTPLYKDVEVAPGFKSIGSIYNQKQIFEIANGKDSPVFDLLTGKQVFAPEEPKVEVSDSTSLRGTILSYLFSLQELVARKMQIINMNYVPNIEDSEGFDTDGWIHYGDGNKAQSPYLQDIVNYKRELNSDEGVYLNDVPTKELQSIYKEYTSVDSGIGYIGFKQTKDVDETKITISGSFDEEKKFGFVDNGSFVELPIDIVKEGDKLYYHTKKYVEVSKILNKPLAYSKDGNIEYIKSFRNGEHGTPTTYRKYNTNTSILNVELLDGKVTINKI